MSEFYGDTDDDRRPVPRHDQDIQRPRSLSNRLHPSAHTANTEIGRNKIMPTITVGIAYTSGYGHTRELANAVAQGAGSVPETAVEMIDVAAMTDDDWRTLDRCDAIIFGSPTYMGSASGAFHTFAEATSARWMTRAWQDKIAAGFTNSGSMSGDKLHTLQYFSMLAAQHGMHWISLGLLPGWNTTTASAHDHNRLGFYLGAGAQTWNDQGPEAVHDADVSTARHLGQRVATHTSRFVDTSEVTDTAAATAG